MRQTSQEYKEMKDGMIERNPFDWVKYSACGIKYPSGQ